MQLFQIKNFNIDLSDGNRAALQDLAEKRHNLKIDKAGFIYCITNQQFKNFKKDLKDRFSNVLTDKLIFASV